MRDRPRYAVHSVLHGRVHWSESFFDAARVADQFRDDMQIPVEVIDVYESQVVYGVEARP